MTKLCSIVFHREGSRHRLGGIQNAVEGNLDESEHLEGEKVSPRLGIGVNGEAGSDLAELEKAGRGQRKLGQRKLAQKKSLVVTKS